MIADSEASGISAVNSILFHFWPRYADNGLRHRSWGWGLFNTFGIPHSVRSEARVIPSLDGYCNARSNFVDSFTDYRPNDRGVFEGDCFTSTNHHTEAVFGQTLKRIAESGIMVTLPSEAASNYEFQSEICFSEEPTVPCVNFVPNDR
jgi:hypothetical protein